MTEAIQVQGLVKQFKQHRALDNLSFAVPTGSVFGFLGPNGAGKTTTIRILLGLAKADAGSAAVLGHPVSHGSQVISPHVGFLPDVPAYYPWMRGAEYLRFCASLFKLDKATTNRRVDLLLELAGLASVKTPVGGYSRGMKQRLGIAQAMINAPKLLILDEPTSALDPMGRHDVLSLISALRGQTTVFFSTHILSDVERVCDQVAVLDQGRVVAAEPTAALKARYGGTQKIRLELVEARAALPEALHGQAWVTGIKREETGWLLDVADLTAAQHLIPQVVAANGWGLRRLEPFEASLEDAFVHLIGARQGATS